MFTPPNNSHIPLSNFSFAKQHQTCPGKPITFCISPLTMYAKCRTPPITSTIIFSAIQHEVRLVTLVLPTLESETFSASENPIGDQAMEVAELE